MVRRPEVLAIIQARGGSKGIPRKNIRSFAGAPLVAYSIAAGLQAHSVTRVLLSTDDEEIASVGRQWGADVPFLRPAEFAQDQSLDLPVFQHALIWLAEHEDYHPDVVVQLRPTSPIRPRHCVDEAVHLLLEHPEADSVRGVVPAGQNPHKMWRVDSATGKMAPLLSVEGVTEPFNAPRQILPPVFWQTGHIDAIRPDVILNQNTMSGANRLALIIDPRYTVDIDNSSDWQKAEWLVYYAGLDMVDPLNKRRPFPQKVDLVVLDFDGVLTDNRVWVDENGKESVAANRSDSMGLVMMQKMGVPALVISKETNPVVTARCRKLNLPVMQGIDDKKAVLLHYMQEHDIPPANVIYVGNDVNDLTCFEVAGCAAAPVDAEPEVLRRADVILSRAGGHGAVREICDRVMQQLKHQEVI